MILRKVFIFIFLLTAVSLSGEVLSVRFYSGPVTFENDKPVIQGFNKLQIPGTPLLPAKSTLLALPPGSRIISVDVAYDKPELFGKKTLYISPPSLPLCRDVNLRKDALRRWERNNRFLKLTEETFPLKPIYFSKVSHFRNIPFIRLTYFPLLYSQGKLLFYPSSYITIHYTREPEDNKICKWAYDNASEIFSNWNEIKHYYKVDIARDSFDYVVLTYDSLFSAFDSLVIWKNSIGFSTKLVSIDSVIAQYPGIETADRIRNFLIDKYLSWGIHYLLIGGNVDMIPMKICYPDSEHNFDTPTDYYFAELTDNWDSDGDGYYGEYEEDSIGFVPEVIVGRFPYNDNDTLRSICRKTINFEQDTGTWKNRALLLAAFNNFENEDNNGWPDCDGAVLMETIKDSLLSGWEYTRMYEEAGLCPSIYPHEFPITQGNVVSEWLGGNYAITSWSGHGGPNGAYRKWWAWDDGDSIPEYFEMNWEQFIYITDALSLDDTHPSIIFSASCSNAATDTNLARALIGNGASGIVAATSYGWYTPGWSVPSDGNVMSLNYYFYYYIISQGKRVGDALFDAKVYYFNYLYFPDPWAGDPEWTPQQNMLDYTLFGDPSLVREGVGVGENPGERIEISRINIYPNPIHSEGFIEYSLPFDGTVEILLYNIAGQRIETLYKGSERAGFHKVSFNKANFSSGIYFIKMELETKNGKRTVGEKVIIF